MAVKTIVRLEYNKNNKWLKLDNNLVFSRLLKKRKKKNLSYVQ